jgi:ribonucleotide monophosphatase NagD (HAD superfamily)
VGDNPGADIRGAIDNGFIGVLVLTGCASENDPEHPADFVVADVASAVDLILSDD